MKYEIYTQLQATDDFSIIDFISTGRRGPIPKRIVFTATESKGVYNLAFGDIDENGEIDDYGISDNGDRNKILATIASVVKMYTDIYPRRLIFFRGSTVERTRLYRMAISLNMEELSKQFQIYALVDKEFLAFRKNMRVEAFLIKRKIV